MSSSPKTCTMCGKKIRDFFHFRHLGRMFCGSCLGYVQLYCKTPEDLERWTIDDLKALHKKKDCDLCGKTVSMYQKVYVADGMICEECSKFLRPQYKKDAAEIAAAAAVNIISVAVELALDSPGALGYCEADDPLKKATVAELRERYEQLKKEETD